MELFSRPDLSRSETDGNDYNHAVQPPRLPTKKEKKGSECIAAKLRQGNRFYRLFLETNVFL